MNTSSSENRAQVLSSAHCQAIVDEVGARLSTVLRPVTSELPPRLADLLDRLARMDHEAPPIVPSMEDMVAREVTPLVPHGG